MKIEFVSNSSLNILHTVHHTLHIPSIKDGVYLPDNSYYTVEERDFHYEDDGSVTVCLWIVETL